jgi:hypothetical protein
MKNNKLMSNFNNDEKREQEIKAYLGVDYDGYYDEEYPYSGFGAGGGGYWKEGRWVSYGSQQTTLAPKKPEEIIYTNEELRNLRLKYSKGSTISSHLREKSKKSEELFRYVSYVYQEFLKLKKSFESAQEELARLKRIASFFFLVNNKDYYVSEYERYDHDSGGSVYKTKRIGLKEGDSIQGFNSNTKIAFKFLGGATISHGMEKGSFVIYQDGTVVCKKSGIYDLELRLSYGKDSIYISNTSGEPGKYEIARRDFVEKTTEFTNYIKSTIKLESKFSNILDSGTTIDPENIKDAVKCWQYLSRIVDYEVYEIYDKKVKYYGTSY